MNIFLGALIGLAICGVLLFLIGVASRVAIGKAKLVILDIMGNQLILLGLCVLCVALIVLKIS